VLLSFALLTTFALACDEAGTTSPAERDGSGVTSLPLTPLADQFLPLPHSDTVTSSVPAFEIKQKGGGIAGRFEITNPNSAAIALDGVSSGTGHALLAWNLGRGRGAVIITSNSTNTLPALDVSSQSLGIAPTTTNPGLAAAADIRANNANSTAAAANIAHLGKGPVLLVNHRGTAGALANFQVAGVSKIRFNRNGRGYFNGGTQTGGADVAEAFRVEGRTREYRPGDVLVISDETDRRVERSDEAYSTRVIGVYATKPGVLLTDRDINAGLKGYVPVGVIGVIPTKVSGENGPIRRGDLLVTAGTAGHAMLGTDRDRMFGAVVGKALSEFTEPGTGVIPVLVSLK
jgi:hypothetical protein